MIPDLKKGILDGLKISDQNCMDQKSNNDIGEWAYPPMLLAASTLLTQNFLQRHDSWVGRKSCPCPSQTDCIVKCIDNWISK